MIRWICYVVLKDILLVWAMLHYSRSFISISSTKGENESSSPIITAGVVIAVCGYCCQPAPPMPARPTPPAPPHHSWQEEEREPGNNNHPAPRCFSLSRGKSRQHNRQQVSGISLLAARTLFSRCRRVPFKQPSPPARVCLVGMWTLSAEASGLSPDSVSMLAYRPSCC